MKLLLLGSAAVNTLCVENSSSPKVEKLYICPGNPGTSSVGENDEHQSYRFNALKGIRS